MRKLATACNVSHGAPCSHYHNKEEFMSAMKAYITDQFSEELLQTIQQYADDSDCLLYLGRTYLRFFLRHPSYFTFLYSQSDVSIDLDHMESMPANYRPYEIYKQAVLDRTKGMDHQTVQKIVISMWAYVHGITAVATMKGTKYEGDWEEKIMDYLRMFQF